MAKKNKSLFKFTLLAIGCLFTISLIPIWISPAQARIKFIPPVTSAPEENASTSGASRDIGSCAIAKVSSKNTSIVKLLPKSNIGLTAKQRPSIMVYVPATTARKAFFSIQDENFNHHYQATLDLPEEAGIMEIKLPASAPVLATGKKYQYSLAMICGEYLEPDDQLISGWIERVESKGNMLNQKVSVELASELAGEGMWYDALSTLAELRKSQPSNQYVANSWQQLLNSVGLDEIAQESIVN
ncbi:protein of unknown function (DUF928) [Rivularia sp. PCC 7116]|uniref:DUF928 domain-containing protein n=1 Tax=Rivularia sp. PCC 7116 TaxID=373994 RepID=UPI00029F2097|nr:DUF928 domain-containing protein [Rivularia sp. PCC 7116]AFY57159.1 protein of unknown function (DUF928) [Rivularia sp. PCC 7116]